MADWEMRPLSLGEILDRTFTLYRKHFLLFLGISAIPHLLTLALNIVQVLIVGAPALPKPPGVTRQFQSAGVGGGLLAFGIVGMLLALVAYFAAYLLSQGGTIFAVSDLYLGKTATIVGSLKRMWGNFLSLFVVLLLNGLAIMGAFIFLIIPGIYVACRLCTCVPAALLEDLGARASLERSWQLTKDNAGRAFLIWLLYFALLYGIMLVFMMPLGVVTALAAKDPGLMRASLVLMQVGSFAAGTLVTPFMLIATSVFYYDLRVKKEAFDLQFMLNPEGASGSLAPPSLLG